MAVGQSILSWAPDLRLPARATLQEFVSHGERATLRVILHTDQRAEVEVNDRTVAETTGFQNATALAELYTHNREILLAEETRKRHVAPDGRRYYHVRIADGAFEVSSSNDPVAFVHEPERLGPIGRSQELTSVIEMACADAGRPLVPAFADQEETYHGLAQEGSNGLIAAIWTSRWRTPFVRILEEDEFSPLFLAVSKAPDGAYFTIYRLADRRYLSEVRSHHEAEEIGTFGSLEAAIANCDLFSAARRSSEWMSLSRAAMTEAGCEADNYFLVQEKDAFHLRTGGADGTSLGRFPSVRVAEAYATAHRDALEHFRI